MNEGVEIVRFEQVTATPWKNGLGTTKQLAVHPPAASTTAFEWRISIAQLNGTAPFSEFRDVERCLAMLKGEVTLLRESSPDVTLTPASAPLAFSGMEKIVGRVDSQGALDLNLMYLSSRWRGSMRKVFLHAGESVRTHSLTFICVCDPVRFRMAGELVEIEQFDLIRLNSTAKEVVAQGDVTAYVIDLTESVGARVAPAARDSRIL